MLKRPLTLSSRFLYTIDIDSADFRFHRKSVEKMVPHD